MAEIHRLTIDPDGFHLDGAPFRFIAGAIHYFRVPRAYWRDRLEKLKACGFNAVETYVAWNAHQPTEDSFVYDDMLDIVEFLKTAQEVGLYAIVRPGPYICSEWEFGGLPWWLLKDSDIQLRCMNDKYLAAVDRFYDDFIPRIRPMFSTNGGPILMMQVENEYGSYGDDTVYLRHIRDGFIRVTNLRFEEAGYRMMREMLQEGLRPTAVLCGYDDIAVGAAKAIMEAGLRVPEDISLIGYDDTRQRIYNQKMISSISSFIDDQVSIGMAMLMKRISSTTSNAVQNVSLQTAFMPYETVGPCK